MAKIGQIEKPVTKKAEGEGTPNLGESCGKHGITWQN